VAAAVHAARGGARTLLLERYGRLGGAAVTSSVGPLMGGVDSAFVKEVQKRFAAVGENWELLDLVYADLVQEAGAEILLHCWAFDAIGEDSIVRGVRALSKEGVLTLHAKVVIDATADGDVAAAAGADFEIGRDGDSLLQPMTIQYRLGDVDKERALLCGSEEQAMRMSVPEGVWREVVQKGIVDGELPETVGVIRLYEAANPGERIVNATQVNYVDGTKVADLTRAELEGRRQAIRVTDFLRKHAPGYENCYICKMPAAIGVRETRRILGVEYLTGADLVAGRKWREAVVRNASFVIDIHNPTGVGQAHGLAEKVKPYDIPYGCLVPRTIDGLLVAGRCISGSHEAHASYRVMRILMAVGAAAGTAAALAVKQGVAPRAVAVEAIQAALGINLDASVNGQEETTGE
jgi:hypothetical protein